MWKMLRARLAQGTPTLAYPAGPLPVLPERFRGAPELDASRCPEGCRSCADVCPTQALRAEGGELSLDLGRCLFCAECAEACPEGAVEFGADWRLATRSRADLVVQQGETLRLAQALEARARRLFGRSLALRQVSAGGCGACEAEVNVLGTVVFDLSRFGVEFVASPRHADGLLITGALSRNMQHALEQTHAAMPPPKLVIAVGACAISGGPYAGHPEVLGGAETLLPVDLYVPGCPPHPLTIVDGLLRLLGRIEAPAR